ncbi:MAG: hypothetical protein EVB11_01555 [Winogradskyella sp.]|nr:MAG: hypothetical protein EVB11_01555 [Winogradskyella sp.]
MKNLQNLKGAKSLNKEQQQAINGGQPVGSSGACHSGCQYCLPTPIGNGVTIWTCIPWGDGPKH